MRATLLMLVSSLQAMAHSSLRQVDETEEGTRVGSLPENSLEVHIQSEPNKPKALFRNMLQSPDEKSLDLGGIVQPLHLQSMQPSPGEELLKTNDKLHSVQMDTVHREMEAQSFRSGRKRSLGFPLPRLDQLEEVQSSPIVQNMDRLVDERIALQDLTEDRSVEHEVNQRKAYDAGLELFRRPEPKRSGCSQCSTQDLEYCASEKVLKDHCCCDHHQPEKYPYIPHTCYKDDVPLCQPTTEDCEEYFRLDVCCCQPYLRPEWQYHAWHTTPNEGKRTASVTILLVSLPLLISVFR